MEKQTFGKVTSKKSGVQSDIRCGQLWDCASLEGRSENPKRETTINQVLVLSASRFDTLMQLRCGPVLVLSCLKKEPEKASFLNILPPPALFMRVSKSHVFDECRKSGHRERGNGGPFIEKRVSICRAYFFGFVEKSVIDNKHKKNTGKERASLVTNTQKTRGGMLCHW